MVEQYVNPVSLLQNIVNLCVQMNVSDMHFEANGVLKIRKDGVMLQPANLNSLFSKVPQKIISRLKVLAQMDLTESRIPQDGAVDFSTLGCMLRLSSFPSINGERLVARLIPLQQKVRQLKQLGLHQTQLQILQNFLKTSHGILIAVGSTGSGKSTTLHALLQSLQAENHVILTAEDPVEYRVSYASQAQIDNSVGLSYARLLKAIMRQDPDVIMLGEIRDVEVAEYAMRAAMTGHLTLSSMHAKDCFTAITRLLDFGLEPWLINSALEIVIHQQLLAIPCTADHSTDKKCELCFDTMYVGRYAKFSLLQVDQRLKVLISDRASVHKLSQVAIDLGLYTSF